MADTELPSVGILSIDFSDVKQLTEFTRKKPKYNTDCAPNDISLFLEWMPRTVEG
jgi:hypothetical protein